MAGRPAGEKALSSSIAWTRGLSNPFDTHAFAPQRQSRGFGLHALCSVQLGATKSLDNGHLHSQALAAVVFRDRLYLARQLMPEPLLPVPALLA